MNSSQITSQSQHCTRCGTVLPPTAVFCGKCGERIKMPAQDAKEMVSIDAHVNLERYRITALMRRAPYVQLSLAMDTQQQRPVAIRDIDIQQISSVSRTRIFKELQQEYDLLRNQKSQDVLPLIASFYAQNHLYSIAGWPLTTLAQKSVQGKAPHVYTLQDLLQSGIGLPEEQIALDWILHLAHAVQHLHRNNIVIGTLDPSTILVNQKDFSGQPTLFPSWLLPTIQAQLHQALNIANASSLYITPDRTDFFSPEAKQGLPEIRSDIYSMGALLYLLMTGIAPTRIASQQLRSPREINPHIPNTLARIILKALAGEPSARFQSTSEFVAVLLEQHGQNQAPQRLTHTFQDHDRSAEKADLQQPEMNVTSHKGNNKKKEQSSSEHEESILEPGDSEETIRLTKEHIQQLQGEKLATAAKVVSAPEDSVSTQDTSESTAPASKGEPNTDNQSSKTDTEEERPEAQTTVAEAEQNEEKSDENTAASLESHAQIPQEEQAQPNSSTTEVQTDNENTSSSESEIATLSHSPLPAEMLEQDKRDQTTLGKRLAVLLERVKRFVLDGQSQTNHAVAMVETPMRIQPNKNYTIRIHIMGRNEPKRVLGSKQSNGATPLGGLGSLVQGEKVHIEVRSALYHNYAYIVQQTDVEVPTSNYAAEVTIPMRSITDGSSVKRERLHIFFTDQKHNPLYEKPFVVELFISNLVQSGNEGHNILTIPL